MPNVIQGKSYAIHTAISFSKLFAFCIVGILTASLVVIWQNLASFRSLENFVNDATRNQEFYGIAINLSETITRKLKNGFGKQIMVEFSSGLDKLGLKNNITLKILKPMFPERVDFRDQYAKYRETQKPSGYIRVYKRYWEQMTQNTRALINLAGQAKIGGRKVLAPRVKDTVFGPSGSSLAIYFNMTYFNNLLASSDYATLIDEKEYEAECSMGNASHVAMYFLYKGAEELTKRELHLNKKQYYAMSVLAGNVGWTECPSTSQSQFIKGHWNSKCFCINVTKITEWEMLEREVIQGAKCLTISMWRGIGAPEKTHFTKKHLNVSTTYIQLALKPSEYILNEAHRFRRALGGRYIAVQVRGEKVVAAHNFNRLRSCLRVLAEVVKTLKAASGINQVLIASDMSKFGSGAWKRYLKDQPNHTLKGLHSFLISSTGAVEYKPTIGNTDRGVVALVELTLIAQAQHLITVGSGSFQKWCRAKFLERHRDDLQRLWSLITLCSK